MCKINNVVDKQNMRNSRNELPMEHNPAVLFSFDVMTMCAKSKERSIVHSFDFAHNIAPHRLALQCYWLNLPKHTHRIPTYTLKITERKLFFYKIVLLHIVPTEPEHKCIEICLIDFFSIVERYADRALS